MSLDESTNFGYTLEPAKASGKLVPAGTYAAALMVSPKWTKKMGYSFSLPRLKGVPGWPDWEIEIHVGNYPDDTEGCCLVGGTHPSPDFIGDSVKTFAEMMSKLGTANGNDEFKVTYVDPPPQILTDAELSTT